tara:strand:- start:592 stop:996 length:405 start_codon:yes stop_codon:yes gene_type:complete
MMIIKITPDIERAKSIIKRAEERENFTKNIDSIRFTSIKVENYYEVIKEFLVSLNLIKGLKTINENAHKELIELSSKNNIINEQESRLIDDLRIKRNKLLYEGKSIESIYLTNNEDKILSAIKRLKIQAKNNLR